MPPKPYKNPLAGARPADSNKATKMKKFKKKKEPKNSSGGGGSGEEGGGGGGGGGGSKTSRRSVWGFVGLAAGLAALWVYVVGGQRKAKQDRDKRILTSMLRRQIKYTEHAACRMDCRFVSKPEVGEVLTNGRVNDRKSRPNLKPCPKYVVDARVGPKGKNVQAVFSACPDATNVVTVIDQDTNWPCPPC